VTRAVGEEIQVRDNGVDIPVDVGDQLFQPFSTTKPTVEDAGPGSSITHDNMARQHGRPILSPNSSSTCRNDVLERRGPGMWVMVVVVDDVSQTTEWRWRRALDHGLANCPSVSRVDPDVSLPVAFPRQCQKKYRTKYWYLLKFSRD
jgi:signal transduction histidine kinase